MHGRATGDQPWVTGQTERSKGLAPRPEPGWFRFGATLAPLEPSHGAVSRSAADPRLRILRGRSRLGELRREGLKVRLQDQPLRLLVLLLERAGEVVTGKSCGTSSGRGHVRRLRPQPQHGGQEAAGSAGRLGRSSRFVETLARRGYRFVAPVREREPAAPPPLSPDAEGRSPAPPTAVRGPSLTPRVVLIAVVLGAAALVAYWVGTHAGPRTRPGPRLTLAVLPFDNLSNEADQEYLSDGLTEEMITQLARLDPDRLRVTARSSTWKYKHADRDIPRLRRELGADYVLEGSVRRAGERVRVAAQLVQVVDQTHIWAETYEREMRDVLVWRARSPGPLPAPSQ